VAWKVFIGHSNLQKQNEPNGANGSGDQRGCQQDCGCLTLPHQVGNVKL
jgi:hypothetical protein